MITEAFVLFSTSALQTQTPQPTFIPPAFIFLLASIPIPLLRGKIRNAYLLSIPIIAFLNLTRMQNGIYYTFTFLEYKLVFARVDELSMVFAYVFVIMAFAGILYALHSRNNLEFVAAFLYIGSSLGVVFAGDLFSLYIFWEIMAISSVFLIWLNNEPWQERRKAVGAGFRYIMVHAAGGVILLGGIILYILNTGSMEFSFIPYGDLASILILISFILNAAVPPLSAWLSDAYPEASVTGAVYMTAYTTKTAVYVLLRAFPGVDVLIWLGAFMAIYGVIYAVLENDIRRLLAYHIISQVGYMVAGVGIGTEMAINGSASHAFSHILYKGLLFMGAGAVIHVTGRRKLTELGGIYKYMPITFLLYMIGGFSISAFPLFSGFVSKSMVIAASAEAHLPIVWLMLTLASSGTFLHTGLKLPYFTFFGNPSKNPKDSFSDNPKDNLKGNLKSNETKEIIETSTIPPQNPPQNQNPNPSLKEAPANMLLAMLFLSFLCILIGVYPQILYSLLPYPVHFEPYTGQHITETMQILLFTALGFFLLLKHLAGEPTISLDTDWFYRKGAKLFMWFVRDLSLFSQSIVVVVDSIVLRVKWFFKSPIHAVILILLTILYKVFGRIPGIQKEYSKVFIEESWRNYPGDPVMRSPVGDSVILVLIIMVIYGLFYLV
jgi:multicomponent Na+:H+ antiporter subunit D